MSQAAPPGELGDVCVEHPLQSLTSSLRALRILLRYGGPVEELDRSIRTMFDAIAVLDADLLLGVRVRIPSTGHRFSLRTERAAPTTGVRRPIAPAIDSPDGTRAWVVLVGTTAPVLWAPNVACRAPVDARIVAFLPKLGVVRARVIEAAGRSPATYHPVDGADRAATAGALIKAIRGVA